MIDGLALAITLACLVTAAAFGIRLLAGRFAWRSAARAVIAIELVLILQVLLDLVGLARGHRPQELSTHLAYLAFAVIVLPYAVAQTRGDSGRWSAACLVVALVVTAVLVVRLQTTWRSAAA